MTIKDALTGLKNKDFSSVELSKSFIEEIKNQNQNINAYLEVFDDVLDKAKEKDEEIKNGDFKTLSGIPLSIKDNILIESKIASSASKILEKFKSPYDATVIKKLKEAGAIFLGRVNMDEFAMGGSTENSAFGVTKNPYDLKKVSGGSSGGSSASVASCMAIGSLGSDTGGSVRQPASFCGVVGLKPTYGSVSRNGLMSMGSSLDVIGPITKTVTDAEILFNVIKGKDFFDGTSIEKESSNLKVKKIGVPFDLLKEGVDAGVLENFNDSISKLKGLGFEIVPIEIPNAHLSLAVYYVIVPAEVSSNMARYDGVKYGSYVSGKDLLDDYVKTRGYNFGKEVRRRILLGTYVLSSGYYDSYYGKALKVRELIKNDIKKAFEDVDLILTPTSPVTAWNIGEHLDPMSDYLADVFTVTANIAEIPAISVPSGFSKSGLPFGIQFMAPKFEENRLFEIGKKFLDEL